MEHGDRAAMEAYLARCMTLLVRLDGVLPAAILDQAQHLMDHGEPSIGVEYLAHGIVNQQVKVSGELVAGMQALVLDPADLPRNLDAHSRG